MSAPVETPVPTLAPLQPGTAVWLMDDWDNNTLKKAYILRKVDPTNPNVNQYEVAFKCSFWLSATKFVKESFLVDGGDVLPETEWRLNHPAFKVGSSA